MPGELIGTGAAAVGAAAYVAQKVFGPTLDTMGQDINKVWAVGRDKLLARAAAKTKNLEDGKSANLRVARDVIWNGAVTDDEVCAEYFGGILASCRSEDGKDDSAIQFVDCIKGMSSKQLHLHYSIYRSAQLLLMRDKIGVNPGQQGELTRATVCFYLQHLADLGLDPMVDMPVLHRLGLVGQWKIDLHVDGIHGISYCAATPTTYGVLLYAVAMNHLKDWMNLSTKEFEANPEIKTPDVFETSPKALLDKALAVRTTTNGDTQTPAA